MTTTILTTDRLLLRTWQAEDLSLMAAINADPVVMEYFPQIQDMIATEKLLARINAQYQQYGYTVYATETLAKHEFIGFVGLFHPSFTIPHFQARSMPIVEIGWRLSAQHWGKGFATEAANAVLNYAFTQLQLAEIISFTAAINCRSQRVMEKIGLQHDPVDDFAHPNLADDSPLKKHVLYRLHRDDFAKITTHNTKEDSGKI
jgi:RimJ/RimL family protein N-acetyltransferase